MQDWIDWLKGKKTYAVAIGTILGAVGGLLTGALDVNTAVLMIVGALFGSTIRDGMKTEAKKG